MTDPAPLGAPDRLELGEGIRWADGRLVCVDILTGRLLTPDDDGTAPLRTLARLDAPLGAVAPVAGRPGTWIAAAGTGICLLTPGTDPEWLAGPERSAPTGADRDAHERRLRRPARPLLGREHGLRRDTGRLLPVPDRPRRLGRPGL
ncbi:SMP-30/gluconolactonase/LRE family protein [Streptomyces sp. NPDC127039]|uniref:SMP-30/gluconolactonase/LRE family protein n=1 Tax=Streptomyces sp. NPDC127039 TaxID=3347115 RepID=UPI00365DAD2D